MFCYVLGILLFCLDYVLGISMVLVIGVLWLVWIRILNIEFNVVEFEMFVGMIGLMFFVLLLNVDEVMWILWFFI